MKDDRLLLDTLYLLEKLHKKIYSIEEGYKKRRDNTKDVKKFIESMKRHSGWMACFFSDLVVRGDK